MVLVLSVIPDIDLLIPFLQHRGPTHSIITALIAFVPIFVIYHGEAIPYFMALVQHSLIGDNLAGGQIQLLWPLTTQQYGTNISIRSQTNITLEWIMFLASIIVMLKTKDIMAFFQPHNSSLILSIPTFTVLLPTFLAFPLEVPPILILPHIVYLILFLTPILIDARKILTNSACKPYTKARTINNT
jgi:membrane-bound metal-dependent hydrolase YbcI (DUF457 family)